MQDNLKKLCRSMNINLVYSNDDCIILTSSTLDNIPTIIANRLFYRCPEKIAKVIVSYCMGNEQQEYNYNLIERYAKENLFSLEYIIDPPDEKFRALVKRVPSPGKDKVSQDLTEAGIKFMSYTDFRGEFNILSPDHAIKTSSETVIDLDIVVMDSEENSTYR